MGLRPAPLSDLYHLLLVSPWWLLVALIAAAFTVLNAAFALGYLALGDGLENARPGSFADAFFFSVQTMTTVGYGNIAPATLRANVLAAAEMIVGWMGLAITTGVVFSKFSRPRSRVLFSRVAVVREWEGVPSLMFRMANARASHVVEARVRAMLARTERTREGESVRRLTDLRLVRSRHALFAYTWTAIHPIDGESPLRGEDARSLAASDATIVVALTGFDEALAASVHARHAYAADEVLWNRRFADVLLGPEGAGGGEQVIDFRRFHEVEPERPAPPGAPG